MRFQGQLQAWHAERGIGSIAPDQGGAVLFVHVSAFPVDGPPPTEHERLSFEVVTRGDGCKQAVKVQRCVEDVAASNWAAAPKRRVARPAPLQRRAKRPAWALGLALLLGLVLIAGGEQLVPQARQHWATLSAVWQG